MIVWFGLGVLFLIYEIYAIVTKEKKFPTLSRTIWNLTAWQVVWEFEFRGKRRRVTARPLRWIVFGIMTWATLHLSLGECAFGLC